MKTGIITKDQIQNGTAEAHADIHLGLYGSTNKIPLSKNLPELIERVQKIGERLDQNRNDIESINKDLLDRDPLNPINLFGRHEQYRSKLRFKFRVRERLLHLMQKAVRELTFIN